MQIKKILPSNKVRDPNICPQNYFLKKYIHDILFVNSSLRIKVYHGHKIPTYCRYIQSVSKKLVSDFTISIQKTIQKRFTCLNMQNYAPYEIKISILDHVDKDLLATYYD